MVTGFGILDQDFFFLTGIRVFILITQTDTGLHLIHILSTGTTASERIPRDIGRQNINFNTVIYQRSNKHRSKRGHTFTLRIVGRNTNQTVHTVLSFQITISKVTFDIDSTGLDSGFIPFLKVGNGSFITIRLGITQIHAAPAPEWGSMLSAGRAYIRDYSYMTLFPGIAIMLTVLSLNLIGDGLRDALDPKLKR